MANWLTRVFRRDSAHPAMRQDGWGNVITGLLSQADKRIGAVSTVDIVTDIQARDMWRGDDIAKRVIEVLPNEAMRRAYALNIEGDLDMPAKILNEAESLGIDQAVAKAAMYERAYGGAAVFPVIDGAQGNLATPLTEKSIGKITALHLLEPRELYPFSWYTDIRSPKFGRPEIYRMIPLFAGGVLSSPMALVHESRLAILPGRRMTRLPQPGTLLGWGDNVITAMYRVLADFGMSWGHVATLLQDFAQAVLYMEGLDNLTSRDRGKTARARLEQIDLIRATMRMVVLDKRDKFERTQTPMTNLAEILDRFATRLAAAADMPVTLLMGMSPAGMNATGEADRAFFYDRVSALQHYLTPTVEHLLRLLMLSIDGPCGGVEPDVWSIDWKPLWAPSDKEQADTRWQNMQAVTAAVDKVIITAEEARASLKADPYFVLDDDAWDKQMSVDVDVSDMGGAPIPGSDDPGDKNVAAAGANESPDTGEEPAGGRGVPRPGPRGGHVVPVRAHKRVVGPAPAAAHQDVMLSVMHADDMGDDISRELSSDYPERALEWIKAIDWKGPTRVPLDQIDYANASTWRASSEPDKVTKFAQRIASGWEKPIMLMKRPGTDKMMIVDGHHRALAYKQAGKPVLAYVGEANSKTGPWDEFHSFQREKMEKDAARAAMLARGHAQHGEPKPTNGA